MQSGGGGNVLMTCRLTAILCRTCKEVTDVVTYSFELGNFPPRADGTGAAPLRCEVNPEHPVAVWGRGHPCPRCGKSMKSMPGETLCND